MLRPALRCRLRSVRRCWLQPARRFWSRPAFDMAAVLRFGLLRRCAAVCAALRAASGAALRIGAGVGLLAAAGAAQRCFRRSATGCDCQTRRACSLGCGKGPGGGGGGGFGAVWSVLLNLAEIARIFTSWAVCWSCAAFSVSLRQRRNFSILSRLPVSKNTTQDSGAARCLAWQSPKQFVLLKKTRICC